MALLNTSWDFFQIKVIILIEKTKVSIKNSNLLPRYNPDIISIFWNVLF